MSNDSKKRVLGRIGAHELTSEEVERVAGSIGTAFTKVVTGTSSPFDLDNDI